MASVALPLLVVVVLAVASLLRNLRKPESSWEGLVDKKISMLSPRFRAVLRVLVVMGIGLLLVVLMLFVLVLLMLVLFGALMDDDIIG